MRRRQLYTSELACCCFYKMGSASFYVQKSDAFSVLNPNTLKEVETVKEKQVWLEEAKELLRDKKYAQIRTIIQDERAADIADVLQDLPQDIFLILYRILPKELAAEVFVEMESSRQAFLINAFTDYELRQVLNELYLDDAVAVIEELPANVVNRVLKNASPDDRKTINELLQYPSDSAGSIMTTEYVNLKEDMTVEEAFSLIRKEAIDKETIYTCYVTAPTRKLLGTVSAKALMLSPLTAKIRDIIEQNPISVTTHTNKEEVGILFGKYDLLVLPVVDTENRMVGIITVDDAIDVLQAAAEEDFAVMAAITPPPPDATYLRTPALSIFKSRIPWLMLLMISATFTGLIISSFEASLSACVALTAFIPMLMDTGGNCGNQASVTIVRGLSLGEIHFSDILRVIWKELRVSVLCAVVLSVLAYGKIMLVDYYLLGNITASEAFVVPPTVCLTLICTVITAKLIGCTLPILAKKLGFDPAVMASPFITTIVDAISLAVYFGIAILLIPGIR